MEKSNKRYNKSHLGTQPIRVLQHNLIAYHENTHPDFLNAVKQTVLKGLKLGISYQINEDPMFDSSKNIKQTPYVDVNKKIFIHETFCSYIWCLSYSLVVIYDEAVAKPSQNIYLNEQVNEIDENLIAEAQRLFDYAKRIIWTFTLWDKETMINPEEYSDEEQFWVERANSIYLHAMNFILCHEYAHVELGHMDLLKRYTPTNAQILAREKEADQLAIDLMLKGETPETRTTVRLGILIALCSLLYLRKATISPTHPHTDDRIHNFLLQINPEDTDPLWGLASLSYRLWDVQFSKSFIYLEKIGSYKEMYLDLKRQVEAEKL